MDRIQSLKPPPLAVPDAETLRIRHNDENCVRMHRKDGQEVCAVSRDHNGAIAAIMDELDGVRVKGRLLSKTAEVLVGRAYRLPMLIHFLGPRDKMKEMREFIHLVLEDEDMMDRVVVHDRKVIDLSL